MTYKLMSLKNYTISLLKVKTETETSSNALEFLHLLLFIGQTVKNRNTY